MSLTPERTAELQELCRQYRIDVLTAFTAHSPATRAAACLPVRSSRCCTSSGCMSTPRTPTTRIATALCSARARCAHALP